MTYLVIESDGQYVYIILVQLPNYFLHRILAWFVQRVCTSREEMGGGWGPFFTQIEPN